MSCTVLLVIASGADHLDLHLQLSPPKKKKPVKARKPNRSAAFRFAQGEAREVDDDEADEAQEREKKIKRVVKKPATISTGTCSVQLNIDYQAVFEQVVTVLNTTKRDDLIEASNRLGEMVCLASSHPSMQTRRFELLQRCRRRAMRGVAANKLQSLARHFYNQLVQGDAEVCVFLT